MATKRKKLLPLKRAHTPTREHGVERGMREIKKGKVKNDGEKEAAMMAREDGEEGRIRDNSLPSTRIHACAQESEKGRWEREEKGKKKM